MTPALHIAHDGGGVDLEAASRAAADFLSALGVAIDTEDLRDTPARMARAYAELFDARPLRLTTFANDEGYDELVLARGIPFRTVCEHPTARRPSRRPCWAPCGPTRAAGRSSSRWLAYHTEHFR